MKAGEVVQNVICCGHCQNTSIQRMAFSPNDSILVGPLGYPHPVKSCSLSTSTLAELLLVRHTARSAHLLQFFGFSLL